MMNIKQLEYFRVAAAEQNFTKAANRLHIAQPPLSRQIRLLEDDLGVKLFKRSRQGVQLTREARYLESELSHIFDRLANIRRHISTIQRTAEGSLSIGYVGAAMHAALPRILRNFTLAFPDVSLQLHEMDGAQQLESLMSNRIGVGFLRSRVDHANIQFQLIHEESFVLVTPREVKIHARLTNLAELHALPFIAFPLNCAPEMVRSIYALLDKLKLHPARIHESSQINSIVRIVDSGMGFSILPASALKGYHLSVNTVDLAAFRPRARLYATARRDSSNVLVKSILKIANET